VVANEGWQLVISYELTVEEGCRNEEQPKITIFKRIPDSFRPIDPRKKLFLIVPYLVFIDPRRPHLLNDKVFKPPCQLSILVGIGHKKPYLSPAVIRHR